MTEAEILKLIRQAVRQELAPILLGSVVATSDVNRTDVVRFGTDSTLQGLRNIQPYGLASRPPAGMAALVVPINADPTNQLAVGNFDENRPQVGEGEVALYGPAGQSIWFKADGSIYQGSGGNADEPIVLGTVLAEALKMIVQAFSNSPTIGVDSLGGPVQLGPDVKAKLQQYVQKYIDEADTNFLSGKNFVERA